MEATKTAPKTVQIGDFLKELLLDRDSETTSKNPVKTMIS